jgi:hypothetical protein
MAAVAALILPIFYAANHQAVADRTMRAYIASLWQTRFQRTVNTAFFAVAAVVRAWSFLNDKASRRAGARVSTSAALSLYSWLSSPLA